MPGSPTPSTAFQPACHLSPSPLVLRLSSASATAVAVAALNGGGKKIGYLRFGSDLQGDHGGQSLHFADYIFYVKFNYILSHPQ